MEFFLGQIYQFAFSGAPQWWMECAGQTLQISQYQSLYSLIGTKFGGNGTTTFCLPDLQSAKLFSAGMKYYICVVGGIYPTHN
jgi:microcystin-dependent protein